MKHEKYDSKTLGSGQTHILQWFFLFNKGFLKDKHPLSFNAYLFEINEKFIVGRSAHNCFTASTGMDSQSVVRALRHIWINICKLRWHLICVSLYTTKSMFKGNSFQICIWRDSDFIFLKITLLYCFVH